MLLVTGANGFIGSHVLALFSQVESQSHQQGQRVCALARSPIAGVSTHLADLRDLASIRAALDQAHPSAIIHAGAMRDPAACEKSRDESTLVNFHATRAIARWCQEHGTRLIFLSTDLVFDGVSRAGAQTSMSPSIQAASVPSASESLPDVQSAGLLCESAPRRPINHYGVTKALAEDVVFATPRATVARIALTLGHSPVDQPARSPHEFVVNALRAGQPVKLFVNEYRTPIHVDDAAAALVALLDHEVPCVHVGGPDRVSRMEMGIALASAYNLNATLCTPGFHDAQSSGLFRPLDTAMNTTLLRTLLADAPGVPTPRSMAAMARDLAASDQCRE